MPRPPAWAMAMASRLSVTVSMAADTSGMFRPISRVNRVAVSTWVGMTSDGPGSSKTSSKVSPSRISMGVPRFAGWLYASEAARGKGWWMVMRVSASDLYWRGLSAPE